MKNIFIEPNVSAGVDLIPIIGEYAWHSVTIDPSIAAVSEEHFSSIYRELSCMGMLRPGLKILEVGAYAHITGYRLSDTLGAQVTLCDISPDTLRMGQCIGAQHGFQVDKVRRVAADFHDLPFDNEEFDVVYIASALHHSWRWRLVLSELMRVAKCGGLLILENEPCRRELCFYLFRTNRLNDFSAQERYLNDSGLLRTIAEPYLGSRAEQLFGMTENQEMNLGDLLSEVVKDCDLASLRLAPEICMESFERKIESCFFVNNAKDRNTQMESVLKEFLLAPKATEAIIGVNGCSSFGEEHVGAMLSKLTRLFDNDSAYGRGRLAVSGFRDVAEDLRSQVEVSLRRMTDLGFVKDIDIDRAVLFGSSVRLVSKKVRPSSTIRPLNRLIADSDLELGFAPRVRALFESSAMLLPHFQKASRSDVATAMYPDWSVVSDTNGTTVALPLVDNPRIRVPALHGEHLIVFVRVYGVVTRPWELRLVIDGEDRCAVTFETSTSALLVTSVSNVHGPVDIRLVPSRTPLDRERPAFSVSMVGALRIAP